MKKLFALVMVLAMALAIAAPALASGWDAIPTTPTALEDITVEITALETTPNTSKLGSLYEQLSVMYPVVKGTDVHFFVEVTLPTAAKLSAANTALLTSKGLKYVMTPAANLTAPTVVYYKDGVVVTAAAATWDLTDTTANFVLADAGAVYGFEYTAEGTKAGEAVCSATIGFYNVWAATAFAWDNDADGVNEYTVRVDNFATPTSFTVWQDETALSFDNFVFPVLDGKINTAVEMTMYVAGTNYFINRAVNGDITFRTAGGVVTTPADTVNYPTLKAAFDSYFTALGFGYADAKYMTTDHFKTYFGTIAETTVKIVYPSGTVVVTDPSVTPPQTGDATTVVGFVMIALALVAAAAVTVKKVRA